MPHLSELQKRHADDGVTIIAVTKEDKNNSIEQVRKMTADKGDTMAYTVAFDDAGKTYADYMTASGQRGIPTAFLVDKTGRIAYIGHPSNMDIPMARVANGTWDPVKGPEDMQAMSAMRNKIASGARSVNAESAPKLLGMLDEFSERWPEVADSLNSIKYPILMAAGKHAEAGVLGRELVQTAIHNKDAGTLNQIAWGIVDPDVKSEHRDVSLALWAAEVAANLSEHKDAAILDTLARAHFWIGGLERAIQIQEQAVELTATDKRYASMAAGIEAALKEYREALAARK